jgi:glycerate kinase
MLRKIIVAPSGFKESLDAEMAAECISTGIKRVCPEVEVMRVPMMDGGEGFTQSMVRITHGWLRVVEVTGPVGQRIQAHYGFLGGKESKTAVLEMAAAAGLRLVPRESRDPLMTTTYGVGELIKAALDAGAERILIGCGDSGTNDGGAGMAQALGARLLDKEGKEIGRGGGALADLASIDLTHLEPRLKNVQIDVACNWKNVLCGERGVARVFGPQKGASPETVEKLASALDNYANVIEASLGLDVRTINGGGASGGLGAGLVAFLTAELHPRFEIIMRYLDLNKLLRDADLVLTAEGMLDEQSPNDKVPTEVARRAKQFGLPVIALAGTLGKGASDNYAHGIDAYTSIVPGPGTLDDAIEHAAYNLTNAAEHVMRQVMIGYRLAMPLSYSNRRW